MGALYEAHECTVTSQPREDGVGMGHRDGVNGSYKLLELAWGTGTELTGATSRWS
jgi:hypothetical protein